MGSRPREAEDLPWLALLSVPLSPRDSSNEQRLISLSQPLWRSGNISYLCLARWSLPCLQSRMQGAEAGHTPVRLSLQALERLNGSGDSSAVQPRPRSSRAAAAECVGTSPGGVRTRSAYVVSIRNKVTGKAMCRPAIAGLRPSIAVNTGMTSSITEAWQRARHHDGRRGMDRVLQLRLGLLVLGTACPFLLAVPLQFIGQEIPDQLHVSSSAGTRDCRTFSPPRKC